IPSDISPQDWERGQTYARRVKKFSIPSCNLSCVERVRRPTVHRSVLETLFSHAADSRLFPNLRTLNFSYEPAYKRYLRLFVGPTLRSLRIHFWHDEDHGYLLPALPCMCPDLEFMALEGVSRPAISALAALDQILGWRSVTHAEIPCTITGSLAHVSRQASLRSLRLTLDAEDSWVPATRPGFERLERLAIRTEYPSKVVSLLRAMTSVPLALESFSVEIESGAWIARSAEIERSFEALAGLLDLSVLRKFVYTQEHRGLYPADAWPVASASSIVGFSRCPNMVHFEVACESDVTDADMAVLARAWPQLECFSLGANECTSNRQTSRASSPTLASLSSFAAYCPLLSRLQLAVDATSIPPLPPTSPSHRCSAPSICLQLEGPTTHGDAHAIADFILVVFKGKKQIDIPFEPGTLSHPAVLWAAVQKRVKCLQKQRTSIA
ncbi:hypothetical protein EV122DRAFT_214351, partial [Schizophyllum commune]